MLNSSRKSRPPLPERYRRFLELSDLNLFIEDLQIAYEETRNEKVLRVLRKLEAVRNQEIQAEELYRDQELEEFWRNPGMFPPSVRSWFMDYRDSELQ
jgi:hypothetical protein